MNEQINQNFDSSKLRDPTMGVYLEFKGQIKINTMLNYIRNSQNLIKSDGIIKNATFPLNLNRESLNSVKKPHFSFDDEDDWAESLDVSLLELIYLVLEVDYLPLKIPEFTKSSIGVKPLNIEATSNSIDKGINGLTRVINDNKTVKSNNQSEILSPPLKKPNQDLLSKSLINNQQEMVSAALRDKEKNMEKNLSKCQLSVYMKSLKNIYYQCHKRTNVLGHMVSHYLKENFPHNSLNIDVLNTKNLDFSEISHQTRLCLRKSKCDLYEEILHAIDLKLKYIQMYVTSFLSEKKNDRTDLISAEDIEARIMTKDIQKDKLVQLSIPLLHEDPSIRGCLTCDMKIEDNLIIKGSMGKIIITSMEIVSLFDHSESKEWLNILKSYEFSINLKIIGFQAIKLANVSNRVTDEESIDISKFTENKDRLTYYDNIIKLKTISASDGLLIDFISKNQKNNQNLNYNLLRKLIKLKELDLKEREKDENNTVTNTHKIIIEELIMIKANDDYKPPPKAIPTTQEPALQNPPKPKELQVTISLMKNNKNTQKNQTVEAKNQPVEAKNQPGEAKNQSEDVKSNIDQAKDDKSSLKKGNCLANQIYHKYLFKIVLYYEPKLDIKTQDQKEKAAEKEKLRGKQAVDMGKMLRWKKHFHKNMERLHNIAYCDPTNFYLFRFSSKYISSFQDFPRNELLKEFKGMSEFLEKLKLLTEKTEKTENITKTKSIAEGEIIYIKLSKNTSFRLRNSYKKRSKLIFSMVLLNFKGNIINKEVRVFESTFLTIKENRTESDDVVLETILTILNDHYMIFKKEDFRSAVEFSFSLEFMNKSGVKSMEKATVLLTKDEDESSINDDEGRSPRQKSKNPLIITDKEKPLESLIPKKILVFFKPSSFRIHLISATVQLLPQKFYNGKICFNFHRLAYLPVKNPPIEYTNKNLLDPITDDDKSFDLDFQLQLSIELPGQCQKTQAITPDGLHEEKIIEKLNFFFSSIKDHIRISLFLMKKSEMIGGEINIERPKDKNKFDEGENDEDTGNEDSKGGILLARAEFPLILLDQSVEKNFYCIELFQTTSIENDLFKHFLENLNRESIFFLCATQLTPMNWANITIRLKELSGFETFKNGYFGVRIHIYVESGSSAYLIAKFESEILELCTEEVAMQEEKPIEKPLSDKKNLMKEMKLLIPLEDLKKTEIITTVEKVKNLVFSKENRFTVTYEETIGQQEGYWAEVQILNFEEGLEDNMKIICSRNLPLRSFVQREFFNEGAQDFILDFEDYKDIKLLLTIMTNQKFNRNSYEKEEITGLNNDNRDDIEKLDFRKNKIMEILSALLNTNNIEIIALVLKEIHEYLIFTKEIDDFDKIFNLMVYLIEIYNQHMDIHLLVLQNLFNLFSFDPIKSIKSAEKNTFLAFLGTFLRGTIEKIPSLNRLLLKDSMEFKRKQRITLKTKASFDLKNIRPDELKDMKDDEIQLRLLENYEVRKKSLIGSPIKLIKNNSTDEKILQSTDFINILIYIIRILENFVEFTDNFKEIEYIFNMCTCFQVLHVDNQILSNLFCSVMEKFLDKNPNLRPGFLHRILDILEAILKKKELSAKLEDDYLKKIDKIFNRGLKPANIWSSDEIMAYFSAVIAALKNNNLGNSQDFLLNELFLLEKTLKNIKEANITQKDQIQSITEEKVSKIKALEMQKLKNNENNNKINAFQTQILEIVKQSELLKTLTAIFFGNFLDTPQIIGFFITDRLYAAILSLISILYTEYGLTETFDKGVKEFMLKLRNTIKEKGLSEIKKRALDGFLKDISQKKDLQEKKEKKVKENIDINKNDLSKKYLISKLDWM